MSVAVRELQETDRSDWESLYRGYAEFYEVPMTLETLDTVWQWIFDPQQHFWALLAIADDGSAVGLMHYRQMPSPLRGTTIGFLDDLFVHPSHRGSGVVDALFAALKDEANSYGWPLSPVVSGIRQIPRGTTA